jgi:DNA-directed RNA polymerase specialized sigma24 family protein
MSYEPPDAEEYRDELDLADDLGATAVLGREQARVYVLREIAGLNGRRTADVLDKPHSTVGSTLRDARRNVEGAREAIDLIDEFQQQSQKPLLERLQASDPEGQIREIMNTTDLSEQSAAIVVFDARGYDVGEISTEIGRAAGYVRGRIDSLRERSRSIDEELEELRRTRDALAEL